MTDQPRVDVLIPTVGRPSLRLAVTSAIAQTYSNVRICIVSDGPSDEARRVFDELHDLGNIAFFQRPGPSGSGNPVREWFLSSEYASPLVKFLDDDDQLLPLCVAEMVRAMKPHHTAVVCQMLMVYAPQGHVTRWRIVPGDMKASEVGTGSMLVRTSAARGIPWPWEPESDYQFIARVAERGEIARVKAPLYVYNAYRQDCHRYV